MNRSSLHRIILDSDRLNSVITVSKKLVKQKFMREVLSLTFFVVLGVRLGAEGEDVGDEMKLALFISKLKHPKIVHGVSIKQPAETPRLVRFDLKFLAAVQSHQVAFNRYAGGEEWSYRGHAVATSLCRCPQPTTLRKTRIDREQKVLFILLLFPRIKNMNQTKGGGGRIPCQGLLSTAQENLGRFLQAVRYCRCV